MNRGSVRSDTARPPTSELLFIGDAGTTEASRPSQRYGIEWTNFYTLTDWLDLDADIAWTHTRFTDSDPSGP